MTKENPASGTIRPALAAGCGCWTPIGGSGTNDPAGASAAVKLSPARVRYQPTPNGVCKCLDCRNFIATTQTCRSVSGQISPDGWSALWVARD